MAQEQQEQLVLLEIPEELVQPEQLGPKETLEILVQLALQDLRGQPAQLDLLEQLVPLV